MDKLIEALNENLKVIYRKAVDADTALNRLQHDGKGKFDSIFAEESGFKTRNKRFGPYVEELAGDIAEIAQTTGPSETALANVVKKIELLLTTLEQFKKTLKQ